MPGVPRPDEEKRHNHKRNNPLEVQKPTLQRLHHQHTPRYRQQTLLHTVHHVDLPTLSLEDFASTHRLDRSTLTKNFREFWLIQPTYWIDPHRVYEQIFIDGTYFGKGKNKYCLLTAYDGTHVICWHWCKKESATSYRTLLEKIPHPPEVVTLDGHHGALSAIKQLWPDAAIQRCAVHVHRNIITHLTRHPMWMTSSIKDSNPNMSVVGPPGGTHTTGKDERGNYWSPSPGKTTCLPTSPTLTTTWRLPPIVWKVASTHT